MKKVCCMLLLLVLAGIQVANAQKVTSRSKSIEIIRTKEEKKPRLQSFDIKVGGGILRNDYSTVPSYDISIRYTRLFKGNSDGAYWGAQLGSTTYLSYDSDNTPSLYVGGQLGWKKTLNGNRVFDIPLLVNYQYCFISADAKEFEKSHVLFQIQPGIWFNRFLVGLNFMLATGEDMNLGVGIQLGYKF